MIKNRVSGHDNSFALVCTLLDWNGSQISVWLDEMFIATVPIFPFLIPFFDKPTLARRMNIAVTL